MNFLATRLYFQFIDDNIENLIGLGFGEDDKKFEPLNFDETQIGNKVAATMGELVKTIGETAPGLTLTILVLGADFNVSAEERRTLSQLVWHLLRKNNEFMITDLAGVEEKDSQIDIVTLVRRKCEEVDKAIAAQETKNHMQASLELVQQLIEGMPDLEFMFWYGISLYASLSDNDSNQISQNMGELEIDFLKLIQTSHPNLKDYTFVQIVNASRNHIAKAL